MPVWVRPPPRESPKVLVTVAPLTGVRSRPEPHEPPPPEVLVEESSLVVSGFVVPLPPESPLLVSVFVVPLLVLSSLVEPLLLESFWVDPPLDEELSPWSLVPDEPRARGRV